MATTSASAFKPAKIFLPLDFSSRSNAALETASELALQFQSELYLLKVIPMFPIVSSMDSSSLFIRSRSFSTTPEKKLRSGHRHDRFHIVHRLLPALPARPNIPRHMVRG
jgi:hypothetical protein